MKIRVMEVLATLKRAGAERMAVSLATGLAPSHFQTEVISLYDAFPNGFEPVLEEAHVPVHHLGKRRGFDPRMYGRLVRCFRAFRPHVVHSHSYLLRYTFPAAKLAGVPAMVHTVHNTARQETDWLGRMVHRVAYRMGVAAVAVGAEVARSQEAYYGCAPAATIPNGIDLAPFEPPFDDAAWRLAHGFHPENKLAVSVSRLEPQKDPLLLIEAFAAAVGSLSEWHLLLAGEGSLRAEAQRAAARTGLAARIHFLGVQPNVAPLLRAAHLFVLASRWEGTPLAVMEAMAAGLPVVATAVGGVPELVVPGRTGLLAPAGDAPALARALGQLAADPARRAEYGAAGRECATGFGVSAMVSAYAALFESMAGGLP